MSGFILVIDIIESDKIQKNIIQVSVMTNVRRKYTEVEVISFRNRIKSVSILPINPKRPIMGIHIPQHTNSICAMANVSLSVKRLLSSVRLTAVDPSWMDMVLAVRSGYVYCRVYSDSSSSLTKK